MLSTGHWPSGSGSSKRGRGRRRSNYGRNAHALRKQQLPWTYDVTKCAIEGAFMDLAAAFKNFFEGRKAGRKTGYPKFKSKKRSRQSFYLANDKCKVGDRLPRCA